MTKTKYYKTQNNFSEFYSFISENLQEYEKKTNSKNEKIYDIRERTFRFAQRILEITEMLPKTVECVVIRTQLVKAGTSTGANVEEGDGCVTKKDFANKFTIARKEAKESRYWLRLISGKYIKAELLENDIIESQEIIKILSSIINKTKSPQR